MASKDNFWRLTKWIIALVAFIYILPYVLLGNNCYIRLHDNLEGEWIWLKMIADHHAAFGIYSWVKIDQVMLGVPRNVFPTGQSFNMLLVMWLGCYKAYLVANVLIRIIGFGGMVLLLQDYFVEQPHKKYIVWLCALIFCVLPVYVPFGLSVMGQPLLYWAFLNLQSRSKIILSYCIIFIFPYCSSVVWFLVPFEAMLAVAVWYFYRREQISVHFIAGGVLLVLVFLIVNLPMLSISVLNPDFISHRLAYNLYMFAKPDFLQSLTETVVTFFFLHYHVANFGPIVIMLAIALTLRRDAFLSKVFLISIVAICFFQGFYSFAEYALFDRFIFLKSFRFNRFSILLPQLWIISFALALDRMRVSVLFRGLIFPFLIAQLFIAIIGNDELLHNYRTLLGRQKFPNFQNYMATRQFDAVKKYIGKPVDSYYVASLGMSPSVAQYNGLYTLDGLLSIYDLRYKQRFRRIFAGEIKKSKDIEQYFDGWGNRCYIFSAELGIKHQSFNCYKQEHRVVENLAFDRNAFEDLGGMYLISAVEVKNASYDGLKLERVFHDPDSWWDIYLYSIKK